MKLLYVVTRADAVGGASIHVRDLAREMQRRGHEVLVLTGGVGPVTEQLEGAGVPFRPLRFLRRPIRPARDLRAAVELALAIADWQPELVSLHTAKAGWLGRWACARLGVPAVYTPHGLAFGGRFSGLAGKLFRFAERRAARWPAWMVCACEAEKALATKAGIAPAERVRVIYNGVHDVAENLLADPAATPVRIVSVARFEAPKDQVTLLEALAGLRQQPWELHLVGDGPEERRIRSLAARLSMDDRIKFLGYVADPAVVLSRAQLFVLASRSEAFPRSILEAMRAGLPVAATAVGGIPEAVTHGASGILAPSQDRLSLRAAIAGLLRDARLRVEFGRQGRRTYELRFRFDRMADETEALYVTVITRRSTLPDPER
jgi:glycosyltransferase involved in cell wall biosynthesis